MLVSQSQCSSHGRLRTFIRVRFDHHLHASIAAACCTCPVQSSQVLTTRLSRLHRTHPPGLDAGIEEVEGRLCQLRSRGIDDQLAVDAAYANCTHWAVPRNVGREQCRRRRHNAQLRQPQPRTLPITHQLVTTVARV